MPRHLETTATYREAQPIGEQFPAFSDIRKTNEIKDLVITVKDGKAISAHRIVLAARIPFLRKYFKKKDTKDGVFWPTYEYDAVNAIIDYAYTGKCTLKEDTAFRIMLIAKVFQIKVVMTWCSSFITERITLENLSTVWNFANNWETGDFLDPCITLMQNNFLAITKTKIFYKLDSDQLLDLLRLDGLPINREEEVFNYIIQWIENAPDSKSSKNRSFFISKLVTGLRWKHLTWKYIENTILKNKLVKENKSCRDYVKTVLTYLLDPFNPENRIPNHMRADLAPRHHNRNIYVLGGPMRTDEDACVIRYDPERREELLVGYMAYSKLRTVTVLGDILYAVGGVVDGKPSLMVNRFNLREEAKMLSTRMNQERILPGVDGKMNTLFVCGGMGPENRILNTSELYSKTNDKWEMKGNMKIPRTAHAVVAVSENSYLIIGGITPASKSFRCTAEVELHDSELNTFVSKPQLNRARCFHGACLLNEELIIVAGGYHSEYLTKSVEILNLKSNNSWSKVNYELYTPMPIKSFINVGDSLYAFGYQGEIDQIILEGNNLHILPQGELSLSPFPLEGAVFYR